MRVFIKALLFLQIACHVVCASDPNDCKSDLELERRSSHASLKTQPTTRGCFSRARQFVVNNLARLYYATSTVGYDTHQWGPFLKNYYSGKGWNQGSTRSDRELSPNGRAKVFREEFEIARIQYPSLTEEGFVGSPRDYSFSYLHQELEDCVNVLALSMNRTIKVGNNHKLHFSKSPFNVMDERYISYAGYLMQHLVQQFPERPIKIHSLQESSSSNRSGHFCYVEISLDSSLKKMSMRVFDPVTSMVKIVCRSQLPQKSKVFYEQIAANLGMKMHFSYAYQGNQVLNMHDCGRFSSVYLMHNLHGKSPPSLTALDVYEGMKNLEENGYEKLHQDPPYTARPTRFTRYVSWLWRKPADLLLQCLKEKRQ